MTRKTRKMATDIAPVEETVTKTIQLVGPGKTGVACFAMAEEGARQLKTWDERISHGYTMREASALGKDLAWLVWNSWGAHLDAGNVFYTAEWQQRIVSKISHEGLTAVVPAEKSLWQEGTAEDYRRASQDARAYIIEANETLAEVESALEHLQQVVNAQRMMVRTLEVSTQAATMAWEDAMECVDKEDEEAQQVKAKLEARQRREDIWRRDRPADAFRKTMAHHESTRSTNRKAE